MSGSCTRGTRQGRTAMARRHSRVAVTAGLLAVACAGCSSGRSPQPADDASLGGRVFRPPPGKVRALPPHNIHSEGVGPYHLGASLQEVLGLLPHGPRVELLQIQGLVDYRVVRAEQDALFIGVERRGGVRFVAVLDTETARTESGVGVGTRLGDLVEALGSFGGPVTGRDARIVEFEKLPMARFIVEGDRVVAVVVAAASRDEPDVDAAQPGAPECDALSEFRAEVFAASRLGGATSGKGLRMAPGCFAAGEDGAVVWADQRLTVVSGEAGKLKRSSTVHVRGLVFAAPLDIDGDSRHELVTISERADRSARSVWIELYRVEGSRLVMTTTRRVYSLSSESAAWVGANLRESTFLIEVGAQPGAVGVGGFLFQRIGGRPRNIVPLKEVSIQVRPRRRPGGPARSRDAGAKQVDGGSP